MSASGIRKTKNTHGGKKQWQKAPPKNHRGAQLSEAKGRKKNSEKTTGKNSAR